MPQIPLDKAELLALFLETFVYGVFFTCFILLVAISFSKKDHQLANQRFIFPVATLMMVLATAHLVIDFVRVLQAFVNEGGSNPPDPINYYGVLANPLQVAKTPVYAIQTILGDSVLVWRCYVMFNKKLFVLIPAGIVVLANLAIGIVVSWSMSTAVPGEDIFQTGTEWITVFFVLTMGINLCCTSAIVAKIQWTKHRSAASSRTLFPVVAVIIESGAIYTTSVLGLLIAYLNNSNGQYAALDLVTPLVGVVYCLIVLQIHFQMKLPHTGSRGEIGSRTHRLWRHSPGTDSFIVPKAYPLQPATLNPPVV